METLAKYIYLIGFAYLPVLFASMCVLLAFVGIYLKSKEKSPKRFLMISASLPIIAVFFFLIPVTLLFMI